MSSILIPKCEILNRLLVKESHAIFATIPRNDMNKTNTITISRRYRSILHECANQDKTFQDIEIIWNLCEILLLDVSETGTLVIQLKNWIKMHTNDFDADTKSIIKLLETNSYKFTEDDAPDLYWDLMMRLVLKGEVRKTIQLLKAHHEFETNDQLQLVATMLERMPLSNQYIVHEFCNKWSNWSDWCKQERETGQFDSNSTLLNIVRLLSRDIKVYQEIAPLCETWYQLMVAYLMYTDPCINDTDQSDLCRWSITTFKNNHPKYVQQNSEPDAFDEIILAAFDYDLLQVIFKSCSYLQDNSWFVTHFVDLLHASGQLKCHAITEADRLRETFLQDYASTLFDDECTWPIGVSYLDHCPNSGSYHLEALLSRLTLGINEEAKAHKLISLAKKRGLVAFAKSISLLMARAWLLSTTRLHENSPKKSLPPATNLSNALYWAIKSGDTPLTTYISDQYLHYYCATGTFADKSIFESLKRSPLENERLAFLAKYYEFRQIVENSMESEELLVEAGNLIKALLASKIYPRFFCHVLLEDAKALLDIRPELIFNPDKMLDLMKSIEDITRSEAQSNDIDLRKSLVSNMARALMSPMNCEK